MCKTRVGAGRGRIDRDRLLEVIAGTLQIITGAFVPEKAAFEVKLVRFVVRRRRFRDRGLLGAGQFRAQCIGDGFRDLAFYDKDVGQLPIVNVRPEMRVGDGVDQLHIHADLVAGLLHAPFEDIHYAELLRDIAQIRRRAFESLGRCAGNHFEVRYLRQPRQNFLLHTFGEVGVGFVFAQIVERKDGYRFTIGGNCRFVPRNCRV